MFRTPLAAKHHTQQPLHMMSAAQLALSNASSLGFHAHDEPSRVMPHVHENRYCFLSENMNYSNSIETSTATSQNPLDVRFRLLPGPRQAPLLEATAMLAYAAQARNNQTSPSAAFMLQLLFQY